MMEILSTSFQSPIKIENPTDTYLFIVNNGNTTTM